LSDVYRYISSSYGKNHYSIDKPFQMILKYFIGSVPKLTRLGVFVGRELYELSDYIDKVSRPKHIMWGIDGERVDEVWINPAHRRGVEILVRDYGINRPPYHGESWHIHYAMGYLVADPGLYCIITVTNQTAYALYKYGDGDIRNYYKNLIGDKEPLMYGATWFTEVQGGSDLGSNTTEATYSDGKWLLTGEKYFTSNVGLADLALVTARTPGAPPGAKGLSLFLLPKYNSRGERNFRVRRLKEKSGTLGVPTGEIEMEASEAYLIGEREKGIYYTMEDLMVSRLSNIIGAVGVARKAYLEAYYYVQMRKAFGKLLIEHPLVQRDLLDMEVTLEGALALAFKAIDQFDKAWNAVPPYNDAYHYSRLLTHIAKNMTADASAYITKLAMELHGGLGFLSEYPIERWHREALITPIWEGASNIQALDMLEAMAKKAAHRPMVEDMEKIVSGLRDGKMEAEAALDRIKGLLREAAGYSFEETQFRAKDILEDIGHAISGIVLIDIGNRLGLTRFVTIGRLYLHKYLWRKPYNNEVIRKARDLSVIEETSEVEITL
jgi:hypothetical protein